jgi:hypothetical protein
MEIITMILIGTVLMLQLHENISLKQHIKDCETAYKELAKKYNKLKNPL